MTGLTVELPMEVKMEQFLDNFVIISIKWNAYAKALKYFLTEGHNTYFAGVISTYATLEFDILLWNTGADRLFMCQRWESFMDLQSSMNLDPLHQIENSI